MKRFVLLISLCIIISTMLACRKSNEGIKSNSTNQHFKVGDTVRVGDTWKVVVNSVKTAGGGLFSSLKPGNVYFIADISMTNLSRKEQDVSSMMQFTLQDTTGQKYEQTIDPDTDVSLNGKVEAQQPLRGVITWEVPSNVKSYNMYFVSDPVSSGQTTWDLSV